MIKKDKLLKKINRAISDHDAIVPLLNRHVSTSVFFSALPPEDKEEIIARFQDMARTYSKHMNMLDSIKREVSEGETNVY